jgi:hypothetical protein
MSSFIKLFAFLLIATSTSHANEGFRGGIPLALTDNEDPMNPGIDMEKFETALTTTGVEGWVHGRLGDLAVLVYRESDFFHYANFPLVSHIPNVKETLKTLSRHDKIFIKGQFIENGAPQKHIYVTELTVVERWSGGDETPPPYEYSAQVPEDLQGVDSFIGKIHFSSIDGSILVCEYKDAVIPMPGIAGKTTGFYRGDKVRVHFKIATHPGRPAHLILDESKENPVELISKIVDLHGKEALITGSLVKFPKSPGISFDVFALEQTDADFVTLDYTLVNFDSPEVFQAIREKLGREWDLHRESVINGRNKLKNPRIQVTAKGHFNMVAPSQANPQILLSTPDDITFTLVD